MSAATPVAAAPVLAAASPVCPSAAATEALAEPEPDGEPLEPSGLSESPGLPELSEFESSELPEPGSGSGLPGRDQDRGPDYRDQVPDPALEDSAGRPGQGRGCRDRESDPDPGCRIRIGIRTRLRRVDRIRVVRVYGSRPGIGLRFASNFGASANLAVTVTSASGVNVQAASVLSGSPLTAPSSPIAYQPSKT